MGQFLHIDHISRICCSSYLAKLKIAALKVIPVSPVSFQIFILFSGLGSLWKQFLCGEDFSEFHYLTESQFHFFEQLWYYTLNPYLSPDGNGDTQAFPCYVLLFYGGMNLCVETKQVDRSTLHCGTGITPNGVKYFPRLCTGPQDGTFRTATGNDSQVPWGMLYLDPVFLT